MKLPMILLYKRPSVLLLPFERVPALRRPSSQASNCQAWVSAIPAAYT